MADKKDRLRVTQLQRRGIRLGLRLLDELEELGDCETRLSEAAQLEAEYRFGKPYRNVVHERLQAVQRLGTEAEEGFCMIVTQVLALHADGSHMSSASVRRVISQEVSSA